MIELKLISYSALGYTRLLIMDGHTSHVSWQFFDYCLEHNIIPLCLPPHSTHLLQPLDVGLFGPLQRNYGSVLDNWLSESNLGIHKGTFYPYVCILIGKILPRVNPFSQLTAFFLYFMIFEILIKD